MTKEKNLLDDEKFVSLEEIAEEELPSVDNAVFLEFDIGHSNKVLHDYFKKQVYRNCDRNLKIAEEYYGIGQERKNLPVLAEEYSISPQRVSKIVSKPLRSQWKYETIKVLSMLSR